MKVKRLCISMRLLRTLFSEGIHYPYEVTGAPIPSDGKLLGDGCGEDNIAEFLVESQSFESIDPSARIPDLIPVIK